MARRPRRNRLSRSTDILGSPKLTLAQFIVTMERFVRLFARPIFIAGIFLVLAWFGVFTGLYPWVHLIALTLFIATFFHALGQAKRLWRPISAAAARRRVEEVSHLLHRPLDVLDDRSASSDENALLLWRAHMEKAQEQSRFLRWPKWMPVFSDGDPYALRHALIILLVLSAIAGWGALGSRLIQAINPALGKLHMLDPTLDAWITPPDYTGLPPMMIATPAGIRYKKDVIDVPEGSTLSAHLMEKDGIPPKLLANNDSVDFNLDDHGDFQVVQALHDGEEISIRHGWHEIAAWHIHIVADKPPTISLNETPTITERKSIRLDYTATDDYGVTGVTAEITPRESLAGASGNPIEIPLSTANTKEVKRVDFEDLTSSPWSGLPVDIKLIATDAVGHKTESKIQQLILPEREFFQPIARALIEERKKLLQSSFDEKLRNEVANLMAGVAQQPISYHNDPVVVLALRSGAVRLVLNRGQDTIAAVVDILWQSALRIEDGSVSVAEQNLRSAQKELAEALDRGANDKDINRLIDHLHQALTQYLAELSTHMALRPGPVENLGALTGQHTNMLTPEDLQNMLEHLRDLSATGKREAAQQELDKVRQILENIQTGPTELTEMQKKDLKVLKALRALTQEQKELFEKTYEKSQPQDQKDENLSREQEELLKKLEGLQGETREDKSRSLERGASGMQNALSSLQKRDYTRSLSGQGEAIKALESATESLADEVRQSLLMMPGGQDMPGAGQDPFGRQLGNAIDNGDGGVRVPDHMQARRVREILDELHSRAGDMGRPKAEHDYIERLLQDF